MNSAKLIVNSYLKVGDLNLETNNNGKIIFFFGAGASKVDNAPLASELLSESLKLKDNGNPRIEAERIENVKEFLKDIYLNDCSNYLLFPTFEEVLSPIDIAIEKKEGFSAHWSLESLQKLRVDIIYCICEVLRDKLRGQRKYHDKFIKKLYRRDLINFVFLSSNYDILLDNALREKGMYIDYQLEETNSRRSPSKNQVMLLKLHGSLNWKYFPHGISVKRQEEKIIVEENKCNFDYSKFEPYSNEYYYAQPLIVPPTYQKEYDNKYLNQIWKRAGEELEKASKIFFIGYSMPDSDIHIKHLMLCSLYRKKDRPEIVVVGSTNEKSQLYNNYRRIFGEITQLPVGFEGFIEKLDKYM